MKKIIFPHTFIIFLLFNFSGATLTYVLSNGWEQHPFSIAIYVIAFYTLVVICVRVPAIVKRVKSGLYANKYTKTYLTDKDLRMHISMYRGLIINFVFALFKIILGVVYQSRWLFAMAGYNMILSLMRFVIIFRLQRKGVSEDEAYRRGLQSYHICGWLMLVLNMAVSVVMFMVIVEKQTIAYHMIVTIGLATYTFYCFTRAVINLVKYRKHKNPAYTAVKCIDMVKAIVSLFTLQVAMLTTFQGQENMLVPFMNFLTGIAVTLSINTIGALMIAGAKRDLSCNPKY